MDSPTESTFVEFIRYNNWANAQIIAACQKLTAEQLAATAPGTYGTIRDTLEHIIRAEADYVGRMTGERPQPPFDWEDRPDLADISIYAGQVAGALLDAAQRIPSTYIVHEEENGLFIDYQAPLPPGHRPRDRAPHQHHHHPQRPRSPGPRSGRLGLPLLAPRPV
jgi:hypothetical protein